MASERRASSTAVSFVVLVTECQGRALPLFVQLLNIASIVVAAMIRYQPIRPRSSPTPPRPPTTSPWVVLGAALIIVVQIAFLYAGFRDAPQCPPVSIPAAAALASTFTLSADAIDQLSNHTCYQSGLQGQLDPDALATIAIAPDREFWLAYETHRRARRHIAAVVRSYRRLAPAINFVVITTDCSVMEMAIGMGLATIRPESGTDVGDLTYNHAFVLIQKYAATEIVGFALGDIVFGDGLVESVQALVRARRHHDWKDMFAAATRYDLDDLDALLPAEPGAYDAFLGAARSTASRAPAISSEVFLWNRDWSANWIDRPPFVFGGDGFDSWMVGWAQARPATVTIDLTPTLEVFRIRRRFEIWPDERFQIESVLNSGVFMDKGLQGDCDLTHMAWASDRDRTQFQEGIVNIVEREGNGVG